MIPYIIGPYGLLIFLFVQVIVFFVAMYFIGKWLGKTITPIIKDFFKSFINKMDGMILILRDTKNASELALSETNLLKTEIKAVKVDVSEVKDDVDEIKYIVKSTESTLKDVDNRLKNIEDKNENK